MIYKSDIAKLKMGALEICFSVHCIMIIQCTKMSYLNRYIFFKLLNNVLSNDSFKSTGTFTKKANPLYYPIY